MKHVFDFKEVLDPLSFEEIGAFIKLVISQKENGRLTGDDIKVILGADQNREKGVAIWKKISHLFLKDKNGLYYNKFMEEEKKLKGSKEMREAAFRAKVKAMADPGISSKDIEAFLDYWTESNANGQKLRFEMQKTFDINKRIARWVNQPWKTPDKNKEFFLKEQSKF
jgi:hypothetical protein